MLFLTQSRSAYAACVGALLVLVLVRSRRSWVLVVPYAAFLAWVILYSFGPSAVVNGWPAPPMAAELGPQFEERRVIWDIAISMVQDFPFTGIGLGTFPQVADQLYGHALLMGSQTETPHAHNLFLETAVDLGLPGLGFYVLLGVCAARSARRAIKLARTSQLRGVAAGAGCGLVAYYLFGLTDTIGLGEKPGLLFWTLLGIIAVSARLAEHHVGGAGDQPNAAEEHCAAEAAAVRQ
jgi:putative inorganic carbon (HCO3(-)) transporter